MVCWGFSLGKGTVKGKRLLEKILSKMEPEAGLRLLLFGAGTVTLHNLNIGGIVDWFGRGNKTIETGLPYPFSRRTRFPWEKGTNPTAEDRITEWAVPALTAYILVYHPEAAAKFIDAMIPF